jgi:hypothetical protein
MAIQEKPWASVHFHLKQRQSECKWSVACSNSRITEEYSTLMKQLGDYFP